MVATGSDDHVQAEGEQTTRREQQVISERNHVVPDASDHDRGAYMQR